MNSASNRNYVLIIDKSGSMSTPDQTGGKSRWDIAQESTVALARKCEQFDPDGITLYLFSSKFKRYDNVTTEKVVQVFQENDPSGTTNLAGVLEDACDRYFQRKESGDSTPETILVVTDGEPDDRKAVFETIVRASRQMEQDEELAISLIQVGSDPTASAFLKAVDNQMQTIGAKFDIADTITLEEIEEVGLQQVLLNAIHD